MPHSATIVEVKQKNRTAIYHRDGYDRWTFTRWEAPSEIRVFFWHPDRWVEGGLWFKATEREQHAGPDELLELVRKRIADRADLKPETLERIEPGSGFSGGDDAVLAYFRVIVSDLSR